MSMMIMIIVSVDELPGWTEHVKICDIYPLVMTNIAMENHHF